MVKVVIIFISTFILSSLVVPLFIRLSHRLGILDHPDYRKIHNSAIPKLGGVAIFFSFIIVYVLFVGFNELNVNYLFASCVIVMLTGFIDDIYSLKAWKSVGQLIAVLVLIKGGLVITTLGNIFGFGVVDLGIFAVPFTIFACLGMINAVNLIDGMDGLAGSLSILSFLTIMILSAHTANYQIGLLCACSAGATLGFVLFNFNPAKIFMGDAGSNLLGLLLAALSIMLVSKTDDKVEPIIPVLILFIPIFDTLFVMLKRLIGKQWPFAASGDHIHHKLIAVGLSQRKAWSILISVSIIVDIVIVIIYKSVPAYILTSLLFLFVVLLFGGVECAYARKRNGEGRAKNI